MTFQEAFRARARGKEIRYFKLDGEWSEWYSSLKPIPISLAEAETATWQINDEPRIWYLALSKVGTVHSVFTTLELAKMYISTAKKVEYEIVPVIEMVDLKQV
jgi:hypothetical protein